MKPVAIIPARGGSKRIPRKNIVDMNGLPMLAYPVKTALDSGVFSRVIVSTEDEEIKEIARKHGAEVVDRPPELATDQAFETEVYKQVLGTLDQQPEFFCGIYPTAILLEPEDFKKSFTLFNEEPQSDVIMSVSRYPIHPFKALESSADGYLSMVHPKECLMRSQTYPHYVASNGTFYWFRTAAFLKDPSYYTKRLRGYELPASRAVDIDEPDDLDMARAMLKIKNAGG